MQPHNLIRRRIERALMSVGFAAVWSWALAPSVSAAPPPTVPISQTPMTVTIPAHPQIMIAIANSQSVDGNLSGAIMTGSGMLGGAYADLYNSSSPQNYTIPSGFTPPVNTGNGVTAPYTVNAGPYLVDNSASRLNVAKGGITEVLDTYIADADFGLMDFDTFGVNGYTTWVYQMSQPGGFTFTSLLGTTVPGVTEYVPNPCYHADLGPANPVQTDCQQLHAFYGVGMGVYGSLYMVVSASSDDPVVNDVLYAGNGQIDPVCITYGGPNPATPFPPNRTLADYVGGGIFELYGAAIANCGGAIETGPTNAGFVPYSAQVMYEERGFGFYGGQASNTGNVVVPLTSAGATPTPASVAAALAQFTPNLAPETSVNWTGEIKAAAIQSPIAGLIARAQTYFATNPPSSNGCAAQQYVVLVTDGLPTEDLSGGLWPPAGSTAATMYGMTSNFLPDGSLDVANTNDQALKDVIMNLQNLAANKVKTYVIGVGAGVDPSVNPTAAATLQAMAIAGGTGPSNPPSAAAPMGYFPANSPAAVTADLQVIITQILAATQSVASAAVNSTGLNTTSVVYQSQFLTSDTYQDWTGNLFAFPISSTGQVNTAPTSAIWSAATQLDLQGSAGRLIATFDPTIGANGAGIPFEWTTGAPAHGIANNTTLGQDLTTFTPDPNGQDVLQYLRGSTVLEQAPVGSGQFRKRTHLLGDIVSSNPLYIGPPSAPNQTPSYVAFAQANVNRPPVLYVGANDGMLHAFNAVAPIPPLPPAGGNELFAYIPKGVYANLINLVNPYYNAVHQFFVNGSPQASDVQFADTTWHTELVGTEGAGGKSVFALDVTNPSNITSESILASNVLWDFTDVDMGLGFSTPAIANTASGWTVFVGNGYNSPSQKPFIYALNAQFGPNAPFTKIDLCAAVPAACNLAASNGLSTVIAVNSSGALAGFANIVYAGDLQGNLWRVDVSNANPALWTVTVLFEATDASGNRQPITTSPVASLNPRYPQVLGTMVFFATGQLLGVPDLANLQTQTIYGIYDPPTTYATPVTRLNGNLVQQTLTQVAGPNGPAIIDTGNAISIPTSNKGWYIDLTLNSGERVVTDPRLESGGALVLTSYVPSTNVCSAGGTSNLYVINYANGGSFTSPQFDLNNDGSINSSDQIGGANPVGMSLGSVFAAAPTIRTANLGSVGAIKLITESNDTIQSVGEKGSSKSRTAWWEIRK
jgi:type IV pilus assembly protein PilY1